MTTIRTFLSYLFAIVLLVLLSIAGCENSGVTESEELPEKQADTDEQLAKRLERFNNNSGILPGSYYNPDAEPMEILPEIQTEIQKERNKIKNQGNDVLPEEIRQAQQQLQEDIKEFFGVDDLPHTEIAPGVHIGVPADVLKDEEKYKEYQDFLGERMRSLLQLYEKHGLREASGSVLQKSNTYEKGVSATLQTLGYGGSFVTVSPLDPSTVIGNYYAYTEAYTVVQYLDVITDVYADGSYLGQYANQNWNSTFVDLSLGPVYAPSPSCYEIYGDHFIYDGIQDQFFSSDFDCA